LILQQITPDNLLPEIKSSLGDEVGNISKLAIVILVEQKIGQVIIFFLL
jgi:histone-lysine N-methyltransferase SETD3